MSHHFDLRFKFMRRRYRALVPSLVLLGIAFGQIDSSGTKDDTPIQFVSMFSSGADVNGSRTPCQRLRDMVDPSAAARGVTGERPTTVCDQVLDVVAGKDSSPEKIMVAPIKVGKVAVDSRLRVLITEPTR